MNHKEISSWSEELRGAKRSANNIVSKREQDLVESRFRTLVPAYYLSLIDSTDPNDPIAKMALPSAQELISSSDELRDPIGDQKFLVAPRLTHRYPDRALLHVTNNCTMYCRFCFRKNLMNEREPELYAGDFAEAFDYLRANTQIEELILSGGDPLVLSDARLGELLEKVVNELPQIKRLRIHTRAPVTLPSRVTEELVQVFKKISEKTALYIVTHFNHPRELSSLAVVGIKRLRSSGAILLNQSVLLRGVNDSFAVLRDLFVGLGTMGILPYYLHHCDRVAGAEHFRIPLKEGQNLWRALRGKIPGYLLPEYVIEIPGGGGKVPVGESFLRQGDSGSYFIQSHDLEHRYFE